MIAKRGYPMSQTSTRIMNNSRGVYFQDLFNENKREVFLKSFSEKRGTMKIVISMN